MEWGGGGFLKQTILILALRKEKVNRTGVDQGGALYRLGKVIQIPELSLIDKI
jgi:hypothetical protein